MVYGDDVTHLVTEEGIANLHKCKNLNERVEAIRGVAGYTPVGLKRNKSIVSDLISRGIIQRPQDLGIDTQMANRNLLAARSIKDLVKWSDGLYNPPKRFRNW
jgi:malonate decarboxylase alpha subunit